MAASRAAMAGFFRSSSSTGGEQRPYLARLQEAGDCLGLVSGPECADTVERHLGQPVPEALSQAALDTLAIIAYEQPITRADIRGIRSVDSDTVVETLRSRGLVAEDPRFGGRGRPGFLVTTPAFLQYFGLSSLSSLPPRDALNRRPEQLRLRAPTSL